MGKSQYGWLLVLLGVFATALFYGDSMITPAISVLSAVEGLAVVNPRMSDWVIPIALTLLIGLFVLQKRGTTKVGTLFAPVMIVYFCVLAVLGVYHIAQTPGILMALNPWYALQFFVTDKWLAFLALGSVVLAVTGSEALYSDMGPSVGAPMRLSWWLRLPCCLNTQGGVIIGLGDAAARGIRTRLLLDPEPWSAVGCCHRAHHRSQAVIRARSRSHQASIGSCAAVDRPTSDDGTTRQIYIPRSWALRSRCPAGVFCRDSGLARLMASP